VPIFSYVAGFEIGMTSPKSGRTNWPFM